MFPLLLTASLCTQAQQEYVFTQPASVYAARAADWRNGAVIYQVLVDRFAPSENLDSKRGLYSAPRTLRNWDELPTPGHEVKEAGVWSHEIDFWGGDLKSTQSKLPYIQGLGADVLYLNPIQLAYTNHKYDATDYEAVSPEYGTRADVKNLAAATHSAGLKLMLDGVFNHVGRHNQRFIDAESNPNSKYRDWFFFGKQYPHGYRAWANVSNLPDNRLENENYRNYLWGGPKSVVGRYLTEEGVDGWRLDVAYDIGPNYLSELTKSAHALKPGSMVVGEIWNNPAGWSPSLDGVFNFLVREMVMQMANGNTTGPEANNLLAEVVHDTGINELMKCWTILDNHDTPRLKNLFPDQWARQMAVGLQMSYPGCPNVYYGTELGLAGAGDPMNRAPMPWDKLNDSNDEYKFYREILMIRKSHRALRVGDYRKLSSRSLVAFERVTDKVGETVVVLANPTDHAVKEVINLRDGRFMNGTGFRDLRNGNGYFMGFGLLHANVPAHSFQYLSPDLGDANVYSPYKRMK